MSLPTKGYTASSRRTDSRYMPATAVRTTRPLDATGDDLVRMLDVHLLLCDSLLLLTSIMPATSLAASLTVIMCMAGTLALKRKTRAAGKEFAADRAVQQQHHEQVAQNADT